MKISSHNLATFALCGDKQKKFSIVLRMINYGKSSIFDSDLKKKCGTNQNTSLVVAELLFKLHAIFKGIQKPPFLLDCCAFQNLLQDSYKITIYNASVFIFSFSI